MKKILISLSALLLTSCIFIDDIGPYWDKASVDPAIAGIWLRILKPGQDTSHGYLEGQTWTFIVKDGAYEVQPHVNNQKDSHPIYPIKTLIVGHYHFFILQMSDKNGLQSKWMLERYELQGDEFKDYTLNTDAAWHFIKSHYPDIKNIQENVQEASDIKIKTFTEEVFKIFSEIPDNPAYWREDMSFKKVQ